MHHGGVLQEVEEQQQQVLPGLQADQGAQQGTEAAAGQGQGHEEAVGGCGLFLDVVRSSVGLVDGLSALAEAAVGVLSSGEGLAPTGGTAAPAAGAQHADLRRLPGHFLLLFASHLRDSHLLEDCATAAVTAAVGGRAVGSAGGGSSRGVAEGPGQAQAQARAQGQGLEGVPSGSGSVFLHLLLCDLIHYRIHAKVLVKDCMQAPAPAGTLIGPAINQALNGPAFVHLELVLGLRACVRQTAGPSMACRCRTGLCQLLGGPGGLWKVRNGFPRTCRSSSWWMG